MVAAALALLLLSTPAVAQAQAAKVASAAKPTPRAPDGHPDLSGFWQGPLLRNMFESVGGPPFTPAGEAAYQYNLKQTVNPEGLCLFAGIPRAASAACRLRLCRIRIAWRFSMS